MTGERQVLLVINTGRDEATDTARRVEEVLGKNGIGLRVLAAETVDHKAVDTKAVDTKAVDTKAVDTKAVDTKAVDTKAVDTEPADTEPADTEPADTEPADTEPADTEPADTQVPEQAPEVMRDLGVSVEIVDADERAAEGCELVLVLGGDGTFLRAAELARNVEIPVLGVNLGRIGFLAEAEADSIDFVLDHVVKRDYHVEERMTLDVVVRVDGQITQRGWALNEASLEKGPRLGVLGVVLEVDGRPVSAFGCDGVLVSTPTGSTAYAFSAGGPILWPDIESILVVPNNAHALFARPMVTSPNASIAIEVEAGGYDAMVFCDGRREMIVPAGGRLEVSRCGTPLKWVRLDSAPFTDRLVRKFRLPVTGWRGHSAR